jgi:hypothetical protein
MEIIDGLQVGDAIAQDDGSYVTTLVDQYGNQVGTVTRLVDGTAQASVQSFDVGGGEGFDWTSVLTKVTTFLDNVAKSAKQTSDEAQRLSNAAKGAIQGATIGYKAPLDLKPWLIFGGIVIAGGLVAMAVSRKAGR